MLFIHLYLTLMQRKLGISIYCLLLNVDKLMFDEMLVLLYGNNMFSDQDDAPRLGQPVHDRRGDSPENLRDCAEGRRRRRQQDRGRA